MRASTATRCKQLRREIEPIAPRDFARFLFDWQRLSDGERARGPEALAGVLAQLEGFEAPAVAWESDLLPARVRDYSITWLDELCTAGRTLWTRLRPTTSDAAARGTGVAALHADTAAAAAAAPLWTRLAPRGTEAPEFSSRAQRVEAYLDDHGASFFDEISDGARLLRTELEDALAELVVRGRAHCDSFAGCARCSCRPRNAMVPVRGTVAAGPRCSASRMRGAGR